MNTRGIPTAAYQVLHMLSYPGEEGVPWLGGSYIGVPPPHPDLGWGGRYLGVPPPPS